jgi:hypothetical protein
MVQGFTTGRLFGKVYQVSGYNPQTTTALLENVGPNAFTVQLVGTNDYISGPRFNIGGAIPLVVHGQKFSTFIPYWNYLEFKSVLGTSNLRAQITSEIEWQEMAFSKTETIYPSTLAKHQPDTAPFP